MFWTEEIHQEDARVVQITYMFSDTPQKQRSPLDKGDHPELDETDFCTHEDMKKYQSMIGALQWLVSLGRFDIQTAVMSMSRFRAEPRIGHLERVKRIYGYLASHDKGAIRKKEIEISLTVYTYPHH